ncbi:MAG: hypothetical protein JWQ45_2521 [Blastococcus sp.]|nr:hypothetical protein [Blastococcus sp.]
MLRSRFSRAVLVTGTVTAAVVGSWAPLVASAAPTAVTVPADANIFAAGQGSLPQLDGPGSLPPSVAVAADQALTISAHGGVACSADTAAGVSTPDSGSCGGATTDVASYGGISGMVAPGSMFLAGVFTAGAPDDSRTPSRLDFSDGALGRNFLSLSPDLDQTFFVGDGKTDTGADQSFVAPPGATALHLGIVDAFAVRGQPGQYHDNTGSFDVSVSGAAAVPDTVVTSKPYRVAGYIAPFSVSTCAKRVILAGLGAPAAASCGAIRATANTAPSPKIASSETAWRRFLATKEFRYALTFAPYQLTCAGPAATSVQAIGEWRRHVGFTPVNVGRRVHYVPGDEYGDALYKSDSPVVQVRSNPDPGQPSATVDLRMAVRASNFESASAGIVLTQPPRSLPFVWARATLSMWCDGRVSMQISVADTPTTLFFQDGVFVRQHYQTTEWGRFLREGSTSASSFLPGRGNLDRQCTQYTFNEAAAGSSMGNALDLGECRALVR